MHFAHLHCHLLLLDNLCCETFQHCRAQQEAKSLPRTQNLNTSPEEIDVIKTLDEIARIEGIICKSFLTSYSVFIEKRLTLDHGFCHLIEVGVKGVLRSSLLCVYLKSCW